MSPLVSSFLAVIIISLISIVAIYFLIAHLPSFSRFNFHLVSIAVGSLLGDAFIHLLPEANDLITNSLLVSLLVIFGMLLFFSLEKLIRWHHCHNPDYHQDDHSEHIVPVSLVGEVFHNFIDGVVIASSFMVSPSVGIATSLAVLIHEIPQEIGDFGIYTHQGKSLFQALKLNLYSASSSLFGIIFTFLIGSSISNFSAYILPITAGGFIYLAASDLIPELHRHHSDNHRSSISQIFLVILGVAIMSLLLLFER